MITGTGLKELTATNEGGETSRVQLQVFKVDKQFDVFLFSDADYEIVRITKLGNKAEVVQEAIKQFEELNGVKLA